MLRWGEKNKKTKRFSRGFYGLFHGFDLVFHRFVMVYYGFSIDFLWFSMDLPWFSMGFLWKNSEQNNKNQRKKQKDNPGFSWDACGFPAFPPSKLNVVFTRINAALFDGFRRCLPQKQQLYVCICDI